MKISVKAWHYRYMTWLGFSVPSTLCPYFWKLVFSLLVPLVAAALLGIVAAGLVVLVGWAIHHLGLFAFWAAIVLGVVVALVGTGWLAFSDRGREVRYTIRRTPLGGGIGEGAEIASSYIAAVHHKLCPILEFVDGPRPELHVI